MNEVVEALKLARDAQRVAREANLRLAAITLELSNAIENLETIVTMADDEYITDTANETLSPLQKILT